MLRFARSTQSTLLGSSLRLAAYASNHSASGLPDAGGLPLHPDPSSSGSGSSDPGQPSTVDFGYQSVPREEKQSLVARVFSGVAPSYDIMNDLMSAGMHRLWKDHLVARVKPFAGMCHLDIAGGTGDIGFRVQDAIQRDAAAREAQGLPQRPDPGVVTISDINPDMLAQGEARASTAGRMQRDVALQFVEGNAEQLSWVPDSSVDAYTIAFGIRNVTHRDRALAEAHRVLRPGGVLAVMEFSKVVLPGLREVYDAYSFNVIPKIGGLVANDEASYQYLVESIRTFPDQESFAESIRAAGFRSVTYENLSAGIVAIHTGFKV